MKNLMTILLGLIFFCFISCQNMYKAIRTTDNNIIVVHYNENDSIIFGNGYFVYRGELIEYRYESIRDILIYGYLPYIYNFSDYEYRNVYLKFFNDSIFAITCYSNSIEGMENFKIDEVYKYHFETKFYTIIVDSLLKTNRNLKDNRPIMKPYDHKALFSSRKYNKFPYLSGDTIHVTLDASKMRIGYFTFDKIDRMTPEEGMLLELIPKSLDDTTKN